MSAAAVENRPPLLAPPARLQPARRGSCSASAAITSAGSSATTSPARASTYFGDIDQNDISVFLGYFLGVDRLPARARLRRLPVGAAARLSAVAAREGDARRRPLLRALHRPQGRRHPVPVRDRPLLLHRRPERDADPRRAAAARRTRSSRPGQYLTLVGMHGTMMMGIMSSAILGPFANYFVPLMIGARRMAFPRIESLTFWLLMAAGGDPDDDDLLRRLPDRLDRLRAAERPGERRHGLVHRLLRARRHLDVPARAEHDRDDRDDARARADLVAAADLLLGRRSRPRSCSCSPRRC